MALLITLCEIIHKCGQALYMMHVSKSSGLSRKQSIYFFSVDTGLAISCDKLLAPPLWADELYFWWVEVEKIAE